MIKEKLLKKIGITKTKKWIYHTSHSYINLKTGKVEDFITQLYQIGVYGILNNDPMLQGSFTPAQLVKLEKQLHKGVKEKLICDLKFGREITVVEDENGFYKELTDE